MIKNNSVRKMILSALFLAIAYILPFLTGQIQQIGNMLCPMHIPVLLCGFICGASWGGAVGIMAPMLRSIMLGMPPMFPTAFCMALELGTYGFMTGWLYNKLSKEKINIYVALIGSMIVGRLVWGIAMFSCMGFDGSKFGVSAFLAGAVLNAIPGIALQIVFIPLLVITLEKYLELKPDIL